MLVYRNEKSFSLMIFFLKKCACVRLYMVLFICVYVWIYVRMAIWTYVRIAVCTHGRNA